VAPVPYRGQRCEPWMVKEVYQKIATIKQLPLEQIVRHIRDNITAFYKI